jgi:hypothetical protein
MTVYTKEDSRPFKWILAIIVFVLAMTLTMSDVYGLSVPSSSRANNTMMTQPYSNIRMAQMHGYPVIYRSHDENVKVDPSNHDQDVSPEVVPEPATFILVAAGLGMAYFSMRKKS